MEERQIKETMARLVGWLFLPSFFTNLLQHLWYRQKYHSNPGAIPSKGTTAFRKHNSWIFCGVALAYLAFVVIEVDRSFVSTHYDTLDIEFRGFTQRQLKSNFRKASLQYHPDKVGEAGAEMFVRIRGAYEVLSDPTLREAYNRFGSSSTKCTTCVTYKDHLHTGLSIMNAYYSAAFFALAVISPFSRAKYGRYWRFVTLGAMYAWELTMILSSRPINVMGWVMPHRVTFEQIAVLHQVWLVGAMGAAVVGPVLWPPSSGGIGEQLKRLEELTMIADNDTRLMFKFVMNAYCATRKDE
ncbi:hypothetical protein BC939DRAFT_530715 [Gamsiella multidivaricata]|uniref:uncharacterized protein n=1 Tax=Gamsiella multidivaricata TaxID=101098 RepID=UPI00221ED51E|nr:uncharacterized protein BC939DRAFT_530715 [Gamsiella multidivaricata]KAG0366925.1 hypothetical protein BGZ54_004702 [Gamsiella multidivaricata]KAI7820297.1 hypothetical protein BC939DRAFT_530715 [Gamsiella multidivaricata]